MKLTVIKNHEKQKPDYVSLHLRAAQRAVENYRQTDNRSDILKAVNHGVRAATGCERRKHDPLHLLNLCEGVMSFISLITPRELMQLFPIEKIYDGERWGTKDYFSTIEALVQYNLNELIREEAYTFIGDYMNYMLFRFHTNHICAANDLQRHKTGKGFMEMFCEDNGIKTYTMHTDTATGKRYLYDSEENKSFKISRPIPRGFKIIECGGK